METLAAWDKRAQIEGAFATSEMLRAYDSIQNRFGSEVAHLLDKTGTAHRLAEQFAFGRIEMAAITRWQSQMLKATSTIGAGLEASLPAYASQFAELSESAERMGRMRDELGMASARALAVHQDLLAAVTAIPEQYSGLADRFSGFIDLTEKSLARLGAIQLGTSLPLLEERWNSTIRDLTSSLSQLYRYEPPLLASLPSFVIERPPQEVFIHVASIESISSEETDLAQAEPLWAETETVLPSMLQRLDPHLLRKWEGGVRALTSKNPDRIAHASVSIREVFRAVLHTLAPDDAVRSWSTKSEDFSNGRPTRLARFRYATREIDHPPFSGFLTKDVSATLQLLTLFDEGVHATNPSITDEHVRLMALRMSHCLLFLLEASGNQRS